ncbi:hypothetical protein [Caldibacillus debilis]|uniref:Uncharacterized protein n=1 Tax=Caldibacillus debilis GB1 TaxID=1339248 RepID=A0A420VE68_9BACI|nr:hypothetical protein [Caldibacillus debilis]RKO61698.1 hypothetical protein Cdeb_01169 [Caldibacillus debilis GB1]
MNTEAPPKRPVPWWKWVAGWLLPPYGLYLLFSSNRFGRLVKVPLSILAILILVIAVDTTLYPHRVEDALVKKEITRFLSENSSFSLGGFRKAERIDAFVWKKKTYLVYRTLTHNGSLDFILLASKEGEYKTEAVYQTYPEKRWVTEKIFPLPPRAMLEFYEHRTKFGDLQRVWEEAGSLLAKTTEGTYRLTLERGRLAAVEDQSGKRVWKAEIQYELPKKVLDYFRKHEANLGKIDKVFGYEMDAEKESYHLSTDKGWYRVDIYDGGAIEIWKANTS